MLPNIITFTYVTNRHKVKSRKRKSLSTVIFALTTQLLIAQTATISGKIISEGKPVEFANVGLVGISIGSATDRNGIFKIKNIKEGNYVVRVSCIGFIKMDKTISIKEG